MMNSLLKILTVAATLLRLGLCDPKEYTGATHPFFDSPAEFKDQFPGIAESLLRPNLVLDPDGHIRRSGSRTLLASSEEDVVVAPKAKRFSEWLMV